MTPDLTDLFLGQAVVVTEIREPVAPENGALVIWNDAKSEGVIVEPLYSDRDRAAMRRRMVRIVEAQTAAPVAELIPVEVAS